MSEDIARANDVLDRAARREPLAAGALLIAIVAMVTAAWGRTQSLRASPWGWAVLGGVLFLILVSAWLGFRQLTSFRFTSEGIRTARGKDRGLVESWDTITEIVLAKGGLQIRTHRGKLHSVNVMLVAHTEPLTQLLQDRCVGRVKLRI
jgi:hypothetical protein